ncbi:hypothetical protein [Bifidobacterium sp. UBA4282]|uniref:hypothetical protein n=1 Tax=Bifidobacterium sp. UBA4282 TaxID=1946096 RepID=UPI0025C481AE|nr:hypothetical protein [Bifidobacterium sp. UBA4282]
MSDETTFNYTYSAKQQEEIDAIRSRYLSRDEDAMERLRRLDRGTTRRGTIISLTLGVAGFLLLGVGMCCTMVWAGMWFVPGVIVGVIGIAAVAATYPVYLRLVARDRAKVAPEILRLADELSGPREQA